MSKVNSDKNKDKRLANLKPYKKGQSGNPAGRPKDNESWSGVIRLISNMTAEEVAELVGGRSTDLGRAFLQMPPKVQLKYLMTLRAFAGFMFEPNNSLWQTILERSEGKVTQPISGEGGGDIVQRVIFEYATNTDNDTTATPSAEETIEK